MVDEVNNVWTVGDTTMKICKSGRDVCLEYMVVSFRQDDEVDSNIVVLTHRQMVNIMSIYLKEVSGVQTAKDINDEIMRLRAEVASLKENIRILQNQRSAVL